MCIILFVFAREFSCEKIVFARVAQWWSTSLPRRLASSRYPWKVVMLLSNSFWHLSLDRVSAFSTASICFFRISASPPVAFSCRPSILVFTVSKSSTSCIACTRSSTVRPIPCWKHSSAVEFT